MKRISSGATFVSKKVFPATWFVVLAWMLGMSLWSGWGRMNPVVVGMPVLMAVIA